MITEILSGLYIGTNEDLFDKTIYDRYQIKLILNCSVTDLFPDVPKVEKIRLPLQSMETLKLNQTQILTFIQNNLLTKSMILSSDEDYNLIICCLFLIRYGKVSVVDIKDIIKMKNHTLSIDRDLRYFLDN